MVPDLQILGVEWREGGIVPIREGVMAKVELVYCPRCEREVRVTLSDAGHQEGAHANLPDTRYVCLDYGSECEAADDEAEDGRCPVFGVKPVVMGVERARAGLSPEPRETHRGRCQGCGGETVQERVGADYAVCGICGTTNALS